VTSPLDRAFIAALTIPVVSGLTLNCVAGALGYHAVDPPSFAWLSGTASLVSLYLVVLILTTQRGDDRLTERLEPLNLELAILASKKSPRWSRCSRSFVSIVRTFAIA
jgi:uncharacterized membrane protein